MADKDLLMAYSVLDPVYMNGLVKQIRGDPAAIDYEDASIENPDETYVPLEPDEQDPKLFSYAYGQDPAILMSRVVTPEPGPQPSTCQYTLAAPDAACCKKWKVLGRDIVLQSGGADVLTNPYGVAQVGNALYLIDYDSTAIYTLGVNELNGLPPGPHELDYSPYVPPNVNLPANAKGQAIIALRDPDGNPFLFALYTVADITVYPYLYFPSILVKITIDPVYGTLTTAEKLDTLAKNAQELIYIDKFGPSAGPFTPALLIPCIGGPQKYDGTTNGIESKLELVLPFVTPANPGDPTMSKRTLLTGDADPAPPAEPTTWDIRAVAAAPDAAGASGVYILTGTMDKNYNQNWRLYVITVNYLNAYTNAALSTATDLTQSDSGMGDPGNYWDIYYENGTGIGPQGDRLWFLKGSPIVIGPAIGYAGAAKKTFPVGYGAGDIGGINVNSTTLVSETMKQAALGRSLKRGLRGAARVTPPEEEANEK